jgi:hypothetical protein
MLLTVDLASFILPNERHRGACALMPARFGRPKTILWLRMLPSIFTADGRIDVGHGSRPRWQQGMQMPDADLMIVRRGADKEDGAA